MSPVSRIYGSSCSIPKGSRYSRTPSPRLVRVGLLPAPRKDQTANSKPCGGGAGVEAQVGGDGELNTDTPKGLEDAFQTAERRAGCRHNYDDHLLYSG